MTDSVGLVLVLGATGETGVRLVKNLRNKNIPVRALVRDMVKAASFSDRGVEVQVGDPMAAGDQQKALQDVKYVAIALGTRGVRDPQVLDVVEHRYLIDLCELAKATGVEHIVLCTSIGSDEPERYPFIAEVLRYKQKLEKVLIDSGINYTIVRPGGLNNNPGGQGVQLSAKLPQSGLISREDVAEVMAQALLQPEARNRIAEIINNPDYSPAKRPDLFKG
jgi:uncharacterized protein YbjT (DUF2867 family)